METARCVSGGWVGGRGAEISLKTYKLDASYPLY